MRKRTMILSAMLGLSLMPACLAESVSTDAAAYSLKGVPFTMIYVEGGTFVMGANDRLANQSSEHEVTLSSYWIGETEVTRALWNAVMGKDGGSNEYPIANVTVPECRTFVEKLNELAHKAKIISEEQSFHMLTEAQWEYAAKGGRKSQGYVYAGSDTLSEVGWTSKDGGSAHKVKQKKPNELGLYDMSGNVYEWVADRSGAYSSEPQINPCSEQGPDCVKRGGSFYYSDEERFTCTYRYFYSSTDYTIGFRICLY